MTTLKIRFRLVNSFIAKINIVSEADIEQMEVKKSRQKETTSFVHIQSQKKLFIMKREVTAGKLKNRKS